MAQSACTAPTDEGRRTKDEIGAGAGLLSTQEGSPCSTRRTTKAELGRGEGFREDQVSLPLL